MTGTTWLITGAARGLGRAVTEAVLQAGHNTVATARRPEMLKDLVDRYPNTLLVLAADVTDPKAVAAAVNDATVRFGTVDVLVNNAGYANLASVENVTIDDLRAQIETNLFGVITTTKAVLPTMRAQGSGRIINISSVGGRVATPGLSAYQTAKWAVNGFSEVLAAEVGPLGIKVTAVEPGGMQTDWAGSSMTVAPVAAGYEDTVGMMVTLHERAGSSAAGDPAKVAQTLLKIADMDEPPTRLLLGSDAIGVAAAAAARLAENDSRWQHLSRSTDRDDATPQQLDPLGINAHSPETVVRRYLDEVVNNGNLQTLTEIWADDGQWHGGSMGDRDGLQAMLEFARAGGAAAFTGMHLTIDDLVASGDTVFVRFTNIGTQTGPFLGAPASGNTATWLGIGCYTVLDGKIREAWFGEDILGMLLQLQVITLPS